MSDLTKDDICKVCFVSGNYPQQVCWALDDICDEKNIAKKDIVKLEVIKWAMLFIKMKDGTEFEIDGVLPEEWKWSISDTYFDKDFKEIVEINY